MLYFNIFRLIWNQPEFRLIANQTENDEYIYKYMYRNSNKYKTLDLEPNGILFRSKSIGKWQIQFDLDWLNKNQKSMSLCV